MRKLLVVFVIILAVIPIASFAQPSVLGRNLIVNGGADAGPAGTSLTSIVASIPGWTTSGTVNVLPYDLSCCLLSTRPSPPDRSFQYFIAGNTLGNSTLTQDIDVSSGASAISGGSVRYTASAFLGDVNGGPPGQLAVAFKNANGQAFSTVTLSVPAGSVGLFHQQQIGLVPPGTARITVTLTLSFQGAFGGLYGAADSLSLQLDQLGTNPASVLGANLISNPGGDAGPGIPQPATAIYLPGWSTFAASVAPYGGTGWIGNSDPGPSDRGVNVFCGPGGDMYQDLDVSAAAASIDTGKMTYQVSAWLGALNGGTTPTLTYTFFDWSGKQLASTAQLGPATHNGTSLVSTFHSDILPAGTRRVHIDVSFPQGNPLADDISFTLAQAGAPVILPSGIVPVYSTSTTIQPGSWVSIYGSSLGSTTSIWNGDFPTQLGGVTVTVNSKPAYLWFVNPTQINFQAPDDTATGTVNVVVTNQNGSASAPVTLGPYGPSFSLFSGNKYAAAIVTLPIGAPGNSGNGFDYIGPAGSQSFPTRPVKAGETVVLYGVGFGPTTPPVSAGGIVSAAAAAVTIPIVTIGGVPAAVSFAGIVQAGLFQLNVVVPSAGTGDKLLRATIGGLQTQDNVYLTLQ